MNLDNYIPPSPRLTHNRFWLPIRTYKHAVMPLMPRSECPLDREARVAWRVPTNATTDDEIDAWELSPFNVGMHCGMPSNVTVLEVKSQSAQDWLDEQELPRTPQWLSRGARYYLFNYFHTGQSVTDVCPGLQLLNDGTFVIYPGSIYEDGRLVYWEESPDFIEPADLPAWLVPPQNLVGSIA